MREGGVYSRERAATETLLEVAEELSPSLELEDTLVETPARKPSAEISHAAALKSTETDAPIKQQPRRTKGRYRLVVPFGIIILSSIITTCLFFLFHSDSKKTALFEDQSSVIESMQVSLPDPGWQEGVINEGGPISAALSPFNPAAEAAGLNLSVGAPQLSFADRVRDTKVSAATYLSDSGGYSPPESGLRRSSNASGVKKTAADRNIQRQDGWETTNPKANLARAESYQKYLNKNFPRNAERPLKTEQRGNIHISRDALRTNSDSIPLRRYHQ